MKSTIRPFNYNSLDYWEERYTREHDSAYYFDWLQ